jgi:hypothetical protein
MKVKIFLSEPGWGPIVRQSSIINELKKIYPKLEITLQSNKDPKILKKFFRKFNFKKSDNLIKWYHGNDGGFDKKKNKIYYRGYERKSKIWFKKNEKDKKYNFFISDMSPEVFKLGKKLNIPTFGICHFTWDWFFLNSEPLSVSNNIINNWKFYQKDATRLFFPPLTPKQCLKDYPNHKKINFIINDYIINNDNNLMKLLKKKQFKILLIDSGDDIISKIFKNILKISNKKNNDLLIFHQKKLGKFKNSVPLNKKIFFGSILKHMDLVIGRAGFNTITEVLKYQKLAIFLSTKNNPEINWNISRLIKYNLSKILQPEILLKNFDKIIDSIKKGKYFAYIEKIKENNYSFDGHIKVAKEINNYLVKEKKKLFC